MVNLGLFPDQVSSDNQTQPTPAQPAKPASVQEFGFELQPAQDEDGVVIVRDFS